MTFESSLLVFVLSLLMQVFYMLAVESRSLVRSTYMFALQATCMLFVFVTYALTANNSWLLVWAALHGFLSMYLLPFFAGGLLYTAERMPAERAPSPVGTALYLVLATLIALVVGTYRDVVVVTGLTPLDELGRSVGLNLLTAGMLFVYGAVSILTHRHPFKVVLGVLMMTSGVDLALLHVAPGHLTVAKIGMLTTVIPSVFMILYVNRLVVRKLKVTDTALLAELRY
jgi:hydrogenase-4 membrane subunit HyfE